MTKLQKENCEIHTKRILPILLKMQNVSNSKQPIEGLN